MAIIVTCSPTSHNGINALQSNLIHIRWVLHFEVMPNRWSLLTINHHLIWLWAADVSLLKLTPMFACWFCVPLTNNVFTLLQPAFPVHVTLCTDCSCSSGHPNCHERAIVLTSTLWKAEAWIVHPFSLISISIADMVSHDIHTLAYSHPVRAGAYLTGKKEALPLVYMAGLTHRQTLSRSHWADKNLWRFTLTEIKASLYRLHALPRALREATDWNFHRKTDHWPPILRKHQSAKGSFSLWTTLSPLHTCTNMHTYTHSFLGGVRGPYCVSQRKCRHSRGQAIHWSEYRLLHFSASLLCYPTLSLPFFFFLSQPIAFSALCTSCTPLSYNFGLPMIYHLLFLCIIALSVTSLFHYLLVSGIFVMPLISQKCPLSKDLDFLCLLPFIQYFRSRNVFENRK